MKQDEDWDGFFDDEEKTTPSVSKIQEHYERGPIERQLTRPLPFSHESEQWVLGHAMLDAEFAEQIFSLITPDLFYNIFHKRMGHAIQTLLDTGTLCTPPAIYEQMRKLYPESNSKISDISNLLFGLTFIRPGEIETHCRMITEKANLRKLIHAANSIVNAALDETEDYSSVMSESLNQIQVIAEEKNNGIREKGFESLATIADTLQDQLEVYRSGGTLSLPTGLDQLDAMLDSGGLQNKSLYYFAGSGKSGKTSLALDIIYQTATNKRGKSLVVTAEMTKETLAKRMFSAHTGIPFREFRPQMGQRFYEKAVQEIKNFGQLSIDISDNLYTVEDIRRKFLSAVEKGLRSDNPEEKIVLGVIDYLQLITIRNAAPKKRNDIVAEVSREMKLLSSEADIPIIAMSSLNRSGLAEGMIPNILNLRDSGAPEYDAEAVMILHNPAYIPGKPYERQEITPINLILEVQRNGPTGTIPLMFVGPYMTFMTEKQYETYLRSERHNANTSGTNDDATVENFNDIWE